MKHEDLPQRRRDRIEDYLSENGDGYSRKYKRFSASDFPCKLNLKITLEDGLNAFFKYAFYLIDEKAKEVAVFTEHCGYHIFYLGEILLETVDSKGLIIKIDDYRTE